MDAVVTSFIAVGTLTTALSSLLVLANRKLQVEEDPRTDIVEELLPHVNCGACGYPGCRPFAEALVRGETSPGKCTVSSDQGRKRIADFLGVEIGAQERRVARLACAGGNNVARNRARYEGLVSCAAAALVGGGGKGCAWGCLGVGDCVEVCNFDALRLNEHALPVVSEDACTACGDCVQACPKDLFSLQPVGQRLWVACNSQAAGEQARLDCDVACDACGRCAKDAPRFVHMRGNLPVIDTSQGRPDRSAIERCPTGAIVWLAPSGVPLKGAAASKIIRLQPRRDAPT